MQIDDESLKNNHPLLTIAIPTYNRANYLELCLKRISEELVDLSEEQQKLVKVYVSNNASTDNTDQVISQYRLINAGEVEFVTNHENIGGEGNVAQCYKSATSKYVWVIGDDDVVLPGGLKIVLDVLVKNEVDILYVNGYSYSDSYLDEPKRGRGGNGVVEYPNALAFVKRTHVMLTFITALIVRSGVSIESAGQVVDGSNLPQLGWVLPLVRDGKKFAIIKNRIFAAKIENSGGYGAIKVFGENLTSIANSIFKLQPKLAHAIQNGTIIMWFPTYIMDLRRGKAEFLREDISSDLERLFKSNWRYYFFLLPLICLPMIFARLYFILLRVTRQLFGPFMI